jgi:hypothetical protein
MKLRIVFRKGIADSSGKLAEYVYASYVVEIPGDSPPMMLQDSVNNPPEVIGGEWLQRI